MNDKVDPCALLDQVRALAKKAGEKILEIYGREDFEVEQKGDDSPLTAADMASHRTIVEGLERLTPDIPILSEESAEIPYEERRQWDWYWLIDPLDGTKEFIKRNGEFTVNIALIHDGRAALGVVHVPVKGWTYFACSGKGAFKETAEGVQKISVAPLGEGPVRVAGSRSHRQPAFNQFLSQFPDHQVLNLGRGSTPGERVVNNGAVPEPYFFIENIAVSSTINSAINAWLTSKSGHCIGVMDASGKYLGVAHVGKYWTMELSAKKK